MTFFDDPYVRYKPFNPIDTEERDRRYGNEIDKLEVKVPLSHFLYSSGEKAQIKNPNPKP